MDKIDLFSMACGFLAMLGVACAAMALGSLGMSFEQPWLSLVFVALLVEVGMMRFLGPLPGLLVMALLSPLAKRWPQMDPWLAGLLFLLIPATAMGLAVLLLHLIRRAVH